MWKGQCRQAALFLINYKGLTCNHMLECYLKENAHNSTCSYIFIAFLSQCPIKVQPTVSLTVPGIALFCTALCVFTYHKLWSPGFWWRCGGVPGLDGGYCPRAMNWCSTAGNCCVTGPNLHWRCVVNAAQETECVDSGWQVKTHP